MDEDPTPPVYNACTTTKIVCRPDCPPGRRTKPENRLHFRTLTEAHDAGYRDCLVCQPQIGPAGPWLPVKERRAARN